MNSLICIEPGRLEYQQIKAPVLVKGSGQSIIRIKRIGICGTDLHAFEGTQPFFTYPRILGHELAGELIQYEGADNFSAGDIVTFIPYIHCGECVACRAGKTNCCVKIRVCGVHIDGGMVEYYVVPSALLVHGNGLTVDELALVEPLSIGAHGIRRAAIQKGEFVLVVGAGPIGLGAMDMARIAGATVIALDVNETRLSFCRERLKVIHTVNALAPDVKEQLAAITNGDMPAVIIDATGNLKAINNAFQYLSHGGRYVLIGLQKGEISFSHPEFHKREATLMSSRNATREDFEFVISCMKQKLIDPTTYITHRVAFSNVKEEFAGWLNPDLGIIKMMVEL